MRKIGVFDSGIGGKSVSLAIEKARPDDQILFVNDTENVPYGTKTPEVLLQLVTPILQDLAQRTDVVVIACNTVSTTLINDIRNAIPGTPFIALEPMIKPAAEITSSGVIAVCATPTTLASERYAWLKETYASNIKVLEPDCSDWSYMIENNQLDHSKIRSRITEVCELEADVIVLGCTHYHWIEDEIKSIAKQFSATVIQPEQAIVAQLNRVLEQLH